MIQKLFLIALYITSFYKIESCPRKPLMAFECITLGLVVHFNLVMLCDISNFVHKRFDQLKFVDLCRLSTSLNLLINLLDQTEQAQNSSR